MSDYTRFAVKPKDQIISQIAVVPIMGIMTTVIGIICTSVAAQLYPDRGLLWEPYALLRAIQEEGGSGARAAVFFACKYKYPVTTALTEVAEPDDLAFSFLIAQFGINIAGNAISGGIDLASMFPKYINLRRGAYIVRLLGINSVVRTRC
jgi:NCS1 family nucleobase:cation symporter-1